MSGPSPSKPITNSGDRLDPPRYRVGDLVRVNLKKDDRRYYLKNYAKHLIREFRRIQSGCDLLGNPRGPLPVHIKDKIRQILFQVDKAFAGGVVEIAGVSPWYSNCIDDVIFNQCYLNMQLGISCGTMYRYHVVIRWTDAGGNKLACTTGIPLIDDQSFSDPDDEPLYDPEDF